MEYVSLIATANRFDLLVERCLPSILAQTLLPQEVFIVNDGQLFTSEQQRVIDDLLSSIKFQVVNNTDNKGAASAWNLGLRKIYRSYEDVYIALLDDDDTWDSNHGEVCLKTGVKDRSDAVISGLRFFDVLKNEIKKRPLITNLDKNTFLTRNPGWQGSNTFVKESVFKSVGGFTEGLKSCNDRDLAFRILNLPDIKISYTNQFTATWYFYYVGNNLTSVNNPAKREGLITFFNMYKAEMTKEERNQFVERANRFFKVDRSEFI